VHCVEKKVWLKLVFQNLQSRFGQLFFQLNRAKLALAQGSSVGDDMGH